ncbi:MAG: tetratricopeptide repeat protein [Candidatus Omnitrophota bacterium]
MNFLNPLAKGLKFLFSRTLVLYLVLGVGLSFALNRKSISGHFLSQIIEFGQYVGDYYYGEEPLVAEKLDQGILYFHALSEYLASPALSYGNIGFCYFYKQDLNKAVSYYQKAISLEPRLYTFYYDLGYMMLISGNIREAVDLFSRCLALIPGKPSDYLLLLKGMPQIEIAALNTEMTLLYQRAQHDKLRVYAYLAGAYFELKDYAAMNGAAGAGVKIFPNDPEINYYAGVSSYLLKSYAPAIAYLTKAIRLEPNYSEAYYYRALCLKEAGQELAYNLDLKRATDTKQQERQKRPAYPTELHAYSDEFLFFKIYSLLRIHH